jgi:hypothetical protein
MLRGIVNEGQHPTSTTLQPNNIHLHNIHLMWSLACLHLNIAMGLHSLHFDLLT